MKNLLTNNMGYKQILFRDHSFAYDDDNVAYSEVFLVTIHLPIDDDNGKYINEDNIYKNITEELHSISEDKQKYLIDKNGNICPEDKPAEYKIADILETYKSNHNISEMVYDIKFIDSIGFI